MLIVRNLHTITSENNSIKLFDQINRRGFNMLLDAKRSIIFKKYSSRFVHAFFQRERIIERRNCTKSCLNNELRSCCGVYTVVFTRQQASGTKSKLISYSTQSDKISKNASRILPMHSFKRNCILRFAFKITLCLLTF